MTDPTSGANKYSGNSNRDKVPDEEPQPKVEKVIQGGASMRKKPLGRRIAENFTGADAHSVGQYVLFDVILPQIKDLVFDVGTAALQRTLFGDRGGAAPRTWSGSGGAVRKGYTPYNSMASGATSKISQASSQVVPSNEFGEIVVETRGEAQNVMDKIGNLIETFVLLERTLHEMRLAHVGGLGC